MALIRGEMTSEDGKKVYATADHHKVNARMLPQHNAVRVAWDDEMDELERARHNGGDKPAKL